MTHPFSPLSFISLIITMGIIMGWTGYSLERQEQRKAVECQEACVKW
jgi:hypothetical protein